MAIYFLENSFLTKNKSCTKINRFTLLPSIIELLEGLALTKTYNKVCWHLTDALSMAEPNRVHSIW